MVDYTVDVPYLGGSIRNQSRYANIAELTVGKYICVFQQSNPVRLFAKIWNVTPTGQSTGTTKMFAPEFNNTSNPNLDSMKVERINSTQAVMFYIDRNDEETKARILTIDGSDNITEGAAQDITLMPGRWIANQYGNFDIVTYPRGSGVFDMLYQIDNGTMRVIQFSVSGNTINETQITEFTDGWNDINNYEGMKIFSIPGSTNELLKVGDMLNIIDPNTYNVISSNQISRNGGYIPLPLSETEILIFDRDFQSVTSWDGITDSTIPADTLYDDNGDNSAPVHAEAVDANTFILWFVDNDYMHVKVVRRLDANTWQTSPNTDSDDGIRTIYLGQYYNDRGFGFPIKQYDADTFYWYWASNQSNIFEIYYMRQT